MRTPLFFFTILCATFGTPWLALAIPPPDLLLSSGLTIASLIGIMISSVSLVLFSFWNRLKNFWQTQQRTIRLGAIGISLGGLCFSVGLYVLPQLYLDFWRYQTSREITEIWQMYLPIYGAPNERIARDTLAGKAIRGTWEEFQTTAGDNQYFVLDVRDRIAYDTGSVPGSTNIRLADLLRGDTTALPTDKSTPIFIVCYLGSTGAIASIYLDSLGYTTLYQPQHSLYETIANEPTFPFTGETTLPNNNQMNEILSNTEFVTLIEQSHTAILDLRKPDEVTLFAHARYQHQPFFREIMTTSEIDQKLSALDSQKQYVFVCNSAASCFQARMLRYDFRRFPNLQEVGVFELTKQ